MATKIPFGSITAAFVAQPAAGTGDQVTVLSTLNQDVQISFAGRNPDLRIVQIPLESSGLPMSFTANVFFESPLQIKHLGTAPTSGNITISVYDSMV